MEARGLATGQEEGLPKLRVSGVGPSRQRPGRHALGSLDHGSRKSSPIYVRTKSGVVSDIPMFANGRVGSGWAVAGQLYLSA